MPVHQEVKSFPVPSVGASSGTNMQSRVTLRQLHLFEFECVMRGKPQNEPVRPHIKPRAHAYGRLTQSKPVKISQLQHDSFVILLFDISDPATHWRQTQMKTKREHRRSQHPRGLPIEWGEHMDATLPKRAFLSLHLGIAGPWGFSPFHLWEFSFPPGGCVTISP